MLLADAAVSIQQFDARLRQLQRERIRVQVDNLHTYIIIHTLYNFFISFYLRRRKRR